MMYTIQSGTSIVRVTVFKCSQYHIKNTCIGNESVIVINIDDHEDNECEGIPLLVSSKVNSKR